MATISVTFDVPETDDLCWTPDGIQCFYDAVLKQAHFQTVKSLTETYITGDVSMQEFYQKRLSVIQSVSVNGEKCFD